MADPIYLAANPVDAEIVRDLLSGNGIDVELRGMYAWGGVGELPHTEAYPRVYLVRESDRERARALLREYEKAAPQGTIRCKGCGESSPASFAVCWNCNAPL